MLELELCGEAKTTAIHDARVVAVVADNIVIAVNQLADDAAVNSEACCEAECLVLSDKLCQLLLELHMNVESTVEEAAACASAAVFLHGCATCIDDALVASQSGIGVRTKH